ncbi:Carboxylesterase protein [Dioscorea alata]|uniref:Carboxylesterase protein n=1 Tax=Dioscorea alata TaxID=55571 RepID=A0ACB7WD67_DIOAL|nr:Carboxylesterase protein [Dioscorea alata]
MPCFDSSKYHGNGASIFYRTYGHGPVKVLLIIGLAGTHESWGPQIKGLTGTCQPNEEGEVPMPASVVGDEGLSCQDEEDQAAGGIEVCCFDNRGMGRSSIPTKKSDYTTTIMARDALALLDHLGWKKAHVFGHSMGGMISCKLAAMAPERLSSLALLNVTGGGFECFPKIDRQMLSLAFRFLKARTPEQRAAVDLETHYTKEYLDEYVGSTARRKILYQDYVKAISSSGMQSNCGFEGQVNACWTHKLTSKELETIRSAGFPISVIHGRDDIIAQLDHARKLAEKLYPAARMVELHGAHLVSHERPDEVNQSLIELIKASKSKIALQDWSNVQLNRSGWLDFVRPFSLFKRNGDGTSYLMTAYNILAKLQLSLLYFFGVFVMGFERAKNIVITMKPVRVAASN